MDCRESALSESPATHADQRAAQRFTLVLRASKLLTDSGEYLCVLRDVSSSGVRLRLFHPLTLPPSLMIELGGGEQYRLALAWQDQGEAGCRFTDGLVSISDLLEETGPFPKRSLRLRLNGPLAATLGASGEKVPAYVEDISQFGAGIRCAERLAIGQHVELSASGLGQLGARVRWRRAEFYGVVFEQSYRLDDLARLVAQLQQSAGDPADEITSPRVNQ